HHALLEHDRVAARDHRLLLVPPGADAVARELARVAPAVLGELLLRELVHLAGRHARPAGIDHAAVDLARDAVITHLLGARLAEHGVARLMTGVAVDVGHVVRADDIALRPRVVALAGIRNQIAARVEDAMSPVGAAAQAAADDPAV